MNKIPFITTSHGINVIINGKNRLIAKDHEHHDAILAGLKSGDYSVINVLDELKRKIEDFDGVDFQIVAGELLFRGQPYNNAVITEQVMKMLEKGYKAKPLINFLEKVEQNPLPESVADLWTFMQNKGLAITDEGDVLAFKYVTPVNEHSHPELYAAGAQYTDSYSQKFDYTPGKTPGMPRHKVEYNPSKDCGVGLHIGDFSYVSGQSCILAVSFSPADVVSIGKGEQRKIRVCRFKALHILNKDDIDAEGYKEPVYSLSEGKMSRSTYFKEQIAATPEGYMEHESAEHWSK